MRALCPVLFCPLLFCPLRQACATRSIRPLHQAAYACHAAVCAACPGQALVGQVVMLMGQVLPPGLQAPVCVAARACTLRRRQRLGAPVCTLAHTQRLGGWPCPYACPHAV